MKKNIYEAPNPTNASKAVCAASEPMSNHTLYSQQRLFPMAVPSRDTRGSGSRVDYKRFTEYPFNNFALELGECLTKMNFLEPHKNFWLKLATTLLPILQSHELITLEISDETLQVLYTCFKPSDITTLIECYRQAVNFDDDANREVAIAEFLRAHNG